MKWMVMFVCLPICGMDIEKQIDKEDLNNIHRIVCKHSLEGVEISSSQETRDRLETIIQNSLDAAQGEQKQLVTRSKVKGATLGLVMSGVAIYTTISSLWNATNTEDSQEVDYTTPAIALVNSGFLFWYSGKELWKVARNHHANRKAERALLLKYILKEQEDSSKLVRSPRMNHVPDVLNQTSSSYGDPYESGDTV